MLTVSAFEHSLAVCAPQCTKSTRNECWMLVIREVRNSGNTKSKLFNIFIWPTAMRQLTKIFPCVNTPDIANEVILI